MSGVVGREAAPRIGRWVTILLVALWAVPFAWMLVAVFRPSGLGGAGMASLVPDYVPTLGHFVEAWDSADFAIYYVNTILICGGILVVQVATSALAGYAFARLVFPFRTFFFYAFLIQLMLVPIVLLVPNLQTVAKLGLYDTLLGVMAPYFASAFGTFLLRQSFREIPPELEEAALIDGARWHELLRHVYLPLIRPTIVAFAIVSVTTHWNEFLWPLMVINSPDKRPLTVGLATFTMGAEGTQAWGVIAAGTILVIAPLVLAFALFQRSFVNSFIASGIK